MDCHTADETSVAFFFFFDHFHALFHAQCEWVVYWVLFGDIIKLTDFFQGWRGWMDALRFVGNVVCFGYLLVYIWVGDRSDGGYYGGESSTNLTHSSRKEFGQMMFHLLWVCLGGFRFMSYK
ncbi:uncharacterized protein BO88DRAFT_92474 [Aspergillus vadensis CBS 113365]|uniref:Uncharacterized protein n=1 Tax=Aspergillus vadensis (strain CBS 113365 / IMI 142717 / IBT 24658) TaxID=1448311 RepID=A0A319BKR4_ASPVC|nr:hypothetical protein BO88DRAFT_92474 [Aspergillus vadensis CBS 113365]PYH73297.1 hypothetical protein BO88DRAFT_92474 [Aspergillus vadensis CBS 113365]